MHTSYLMSLIKECIPHKEVITRPDDKPWYDSVIHSYSRKRDRTKSNASKSGKPEDWHAYKKLRNKVNQLKKKKKKNTQKKNFIIRLKIQLLKPVLPILKSIGN